MPPCGRTAAIDLSTLGFAVFLALGSTGAWGLVTLTALSGMGAADVAMFENLRSAGFLLALFTFGLGCLLRPKAFRRNTTRASSAIWSVGFVLLFSSAMGVGSRCALGIGSFCLGAGHALSFIVWQRLFSSLAFDDACRKIVIASMAGGAAYFAMSLCDSLALYGLVVVALLAANAAMLTYAGRQAGVWKAGDTGRTDRDNTNQARGLVISIWRYVICVAVLGYVNGLSRVLCRMDAPSGVVLNAVLAAGLMVAAMLLLLAWETLGQSSRTRTPYMSVLLITVAAFIALPFFGPTYRLVFAGFSSAAFNMVSMFMMFTSIRVARSRDLDPIAAFGLFAGSVYLCVLAGRLAGGLLNAQPDTFPQVLAVILLSVYAFTLSAAAAGRSKAKAESDLEPEASASEAPAFDGVREVVVSRDMTTEYCRRMKKRYGLTNRESDVLELILRGQFVPQMAEALCVSENTVRSHCKTLYKKLGIHSRQQLFDLVESAQQ